MNLIKSILGRLIKRTAPSRTHRVRLRDFYRGWTIGYSTSAPVTGQWRAVRHGVSVCAGSYDSLIAMLKLREEEEYQARVNQHETRVNDYANKMIKRDQLERYK